MCYIEYMKLESSKSVAFQGEHGAFSETAIFTLFKKETRTLPSYSFADVFEKVQNGECEYGVLPVENSLGGVVYQVWDCLHEYDLSIVAETKIKITHQLITNPGVKLTDITTVYAHYQVAMQCSKFLRTHKEWTMQDAYDTAGSVKILKGLSSNEKKFSAAIAGENAARIFNGEILKRNIQDNTHNYTRFIVISREQHKTGNKITMALSVKHKPGTLLKILKVIEMLKINLTSLHSRPDKERPFEYNFFIEGVLPKSHKNTLEQIKKKSIHLKILGVYEENMR